jgi:hypothetical protein
MRLTKMSQLLNDLGIPTIPHMFSNSLTLSACIKHRIYRGTVVAHIGTKYYLPADMARDGEIDLSYILTAEMRADCFTKPLPKPAILNQCTAMGKIGIGIGNGLRNGLRNGLDIHLNGLGNGHGNGIGFGTRIGIRNAVGKDVDWIRLFPGDSHCLIGSSSRLFTVIV